VPHNEVAKPDRKPVWSAPTTLSSTHKGYVSMKSNNLTSLGEFGFISRIAAVTRTGAGVITGIGDDAAVTALNLGMQLLTSTDMLLEDVHFRRCWHDPYRLGRKSLAVNISDIAAMGGIPRWSLLSLAIPGDLSLDFLDEFTHGFLAMAGEHGVALVGGDTCSSKQGLVISITLMGEQTPERVLRRSGAKPGDEIWVTGTLGDAAMGLKLLEQKLPLPDGEGWGEGETVLLSRLLDPTPCTAAGIALAGSGLVSAMIDISDGILADFGHIAELSGVGGIIRLMDLPLSPQFQAVAALYTDSPHDLALSGGEDYELCFTAHPGGHEKIVQLMKKCGIEATPVGIVTSYPGVVVHDAAGALYHLKNQGFNHFAS
jgi:thiamine-monophosphate kinase